MGRFERAMESVGKTKPAGWFFLHIANPVDKYVVPLTRGRFSISGLGVAPVGVLTNTGAKSGQVRKTPLVYLVDGDNIVLVASKAGATRNPAWFHNLVAHPDVKFLSKRGDRPYRAHEASGRERERLWAAVTDLYAGYDTYQGRTEREIPVMVLEPIGE
jgi:deazaflavin-dependent oxidoreductase (nitroreductase family)